MESVPCDSAVRLEDASGFFCCRGQMFDQRQFGSGLELTKVDLIHEGANEEDAAAGAAQEIFRGERIGEVFPVDAFALVGDGKDQGFAVVFEAGRDCFAGS